MHENVTQAVRQADSFHRNIALMWEDMWSLIQEKGLTTTIKALIGPDFYSYEVLNSKKSQNKSLYIFEFLGKIRFVKVLVKVGDEKLIGKGTQYKAVCNRLGIDPVVPLIVCYGIFEPRDTMRFYQDGDLRRNWAENTVLLEVPDHIALADPSSYSLNSAISLATNEGTNSWYCEKATVKICRLLDIENSQHIEDLVGDLLAM